MIKKLLKKNGNRIKIYVIKKWKNSNKINKK